MPDGDTTVFSSAINLGAERNVQFLILQVMHNLGQIGNDIFLVCSFWFLSSSHKIKGEKFILLMADAFWISVISLLIFSLMGFRFPLKYLIKQFAPNLFGNSWFLACYLLIYAIHPGLTSIISSMKNKTLLLVSFALGMIYCVIYFVLRTNACYYNELVGFVVIYFFAGTVKNIELYKTINRIKLLLAIFFLTLLMIVINFASAAISDSLYSRWNTFINPVFIIIAFSAFGIALNTKIATSRVINYLSSLSLLVYITHTNRIIRDYVRFAIFDWVKLNFTYRYILVWCLLFFVFNLVYGIGFAIIYKETLQKVTKRIALWEGEMIKNLYRQVEILIGIRE